jgi:transcriptional regulator with XRE-family HTH domain
VLSKAPVGCLQIQAEKIVPSARTPHAADKQIGLRIKLRRRQLGMSMVELGGRIGVTFQQVQKYENGVNRIGGGRLGKVAQALGVPVAFFFDSGSETALPDEPIMNLLENGRALRLLAAFSRIDDRTPLQEAIVTMVEQIAASQTKQYRDRGLKRGERRLGLF